MSENKTIKIAKNELRAKCLLERTSLGEAQREEMSASICNRLLTYISNQDIETLFVFWPKKFETNIQAVIQSSGCEILLPRMTGESGVMNFHNYYSEGDLEINRFGIYEPKAHLPIRVPEANSLMIVPALAVDESGYRLGYGGGFYDRYLAKHPARTIACVLDRFMMQTIPSDQNDISVDVL